MTRRQLGVALMIAAVLLTAGLNRAGVYLMKPVIMEYYLDASAPPVRKTTLNPNWSILAPVGAVFVTGLVCLVAPWRWKRNA